MTHQDNPANDLTFEDIQTFWEFTLKPLLLTGNYEEAQGKLMEFCPTDRQLSLAQRIRDWIEEQKELVFHTFYLDKELQIVTHRDRINRRKILQRMVSEGVLSRLNNAGRYKIINDDIQELDWMMADDTPLDIVFPLGEEELVEIYPKNTLLYAGSWQSGKTAYFMNMAWLNRDKFSNVMYFMSELGKHEIKKRLKKGRHFNLDEYNEKIAFYERSANFQDVLDPRGLNLIDYLSVKDNFHEVAGIIEDIDNALESGVAIIAIQKPGTRDYGYGGEMTGNRPRLYVALERGTAKILKGKNWRTEKSPDGLVREYKIVKGMEFIAQGIWHPDYDRPKWEK